MAVWIPHPDLPIVWSPFPSGGFRWLGMMMSTPMATARCTRSSKWSTSNHSNTPFPWQALGVPNCTLMVAHIEAVQLQDKRPFETSCSYSAPPWLLRQTEHTLVPFTASLHVGTSGAQIGPEKTAYMHRSRTYHGHSETELRPPKFDNASSVRDQKVRCRCTS